MLYHLNAYFCIKIIFNQSVLLALHRRWNFDLEEILFNIAQILPLFKNKIKSLNFALYLKGTLI